MNEVEFDAFYTGSYRRLVVQLHALIGDLHEAEDCVQEAFVRAWSRRNAIDKDGAPEAWVRLCAHRLAISRWRKVKKSLVTSSPETHGPNLPELSPDHVALVAALRQLPEAQRLAIVLHHLADLPISAVAQETHSPEGTVKARLSRGRATLATLLSDPLEEAPHV